MCSAEKCPQELVVQDSPCFMLPHKRRGVGSQSAVFVAVGVGDGVMSPWYNLGGILASHKRAQARIGIGEFRLCHGQ